MEYKRLEFVADKWQDRVNADGVRVIEPVFSRADDRCRLGVRPIPGSDPPQVEYFCRPTSECQQCELITELTPNGTVRWCKCLDGGMSAAKARKKSKGKPKAKPKARRK